MLKGVDKVPRLEGSLASNLCKYIFVFFGFENQFLKSI